MPRRTWPTEPWENAELEEWKSKVPTGCLFFFLQLSSSTAAVTGWQCPGQEAPPCRGWTGGEKVNGGHLSSGGAGSERAVLCCTGGKETSATKLSSGVKTHFRWLTFESTPPRGVPLQRNDALALFLLGMYPVLYRVPRRGPWTGITAHDLCRPVDESSSCPRSRTVVLMWHRANLQPWKAALGWGATLLPSWKQKFPFLPRAYTAAHLNLGLR